jgi:hypothetical protein
MKILLLNGPPGCGKDTVVEILKEEGHDFLHVKFAAPLRRAVCGLLDIDEENLDQIKRETPFIRELMIGVSEEVVKKVLGINFFAYEVAAKVKESGKGVVVVSDCGFQHEIEVFISALPKVAKVQLWKVIRYGCSFKNDSRSWCDCGYERSVSLLNIGSLEDLRETVTKSFDRFLMEK